MQLKGTNPLRATEVQRSLHDKSLLKVSDLTQVLLVLERERDTFLPYCTLKSLPDFVRELQGCGVNSVKLFAEGVKDATASHSVYGHGLGCEAIRTIKDIAPAMHVSTENCLCAFTSNGSCTLHLADGRVDYPGTQELVMKQALLHAACGADVVGPASMGDGFVAPIRRGLDAAGFREVGVVPHVIVKSFAMGPYRKAMNTGDGRHRADFQLGRNDRRAMLAQAEQFVSEGANGLLLEPCMHLGDFILEMRQRLLVPLTGFTTSGECDILYYRLRDTEYGMHPFFEYVTSLKRCGIDQIATYAARELAKLILP